MMKIIFLTLTLLQITACRNNTSSSVKAIDHKAHPIVFDLESFLPTGRSGEWEVEVKFLLWWGDNLHNNNSYFERDDLPTRTPDYKWPEQGSFKRVPYDQRQYINKIFVLPTEKCFTNCTLNYVVYDIDGNLKGKDDVLSIGAAYTTGSETEVLTHEQAKARIIRGRNLRYRIYRLAHE